MKQQLKHLTEVLLEAMELSRSIYDDSNRIDATARKFNNLLDIKKGTNDELLTTHISETVISPLAFYGFDKGEKFDLMHVSLSPAYHKVGIRLEKQGAGETWSNYFDFYTSERVLNHISEYTSNDYTNIAKLVYALNSTHQLGKITIEDILQDMSVEKNQIMSQLMRSNNIGFSHIMPFHSQGFTTNMNGVNHLRDNVPGYDKYLDELLSFIADTTKEKGLIVTTGFENSRVLHSLLEANGGEKLVDNSLISILKWQGKFAVMFSDHLYSRHGLRSDLEIDNVASQIKTIIDTDGSFDALDKFCTDLLSNRNDGDFKSRGQRINGGKIKKLAVKKLRKDSTENK